MWPDGHWRHCCVIHDKAYWQGGTKSERKQADINLMCCIAQQGHPFMALFMYCGVQIGGHPLWPFPWRWGYGYKWFKNYTKEKNHE